MAKIVLGQRPESFKKTVEIPLLDGSTSDVTLTFMYRSRTQYAELIDKHNDAARARHKNEGDTRPQDGEDKVFRLEKFVGLNNDADADLILKIADGWDLEDEFDKANVKRLIDDFGGASTKIVETYRIAINEGRLGN